MAVSLASFGVDDDGGIITVLGAGFDRLLALARQGDEDAWRRLYLDLAPTVTGYLRGTRCPSPEDVASETLLQVVRDLHRFAGDEGRFRSWVFSIAHHRAIDAVRREAARPADPTDTEVLDRHAPTEEFEQVLVDRGSSELDALLAATTDEQRDVLLLRYVADLTLHEAAEVLGKEYNAVKALHRRALDALRRSGPQVAYPRRRGRPLTSSG